MTALIVDAGSIRSLFAAGGTAAWDELLTFGRTPVVLSTITAELPSNVETPWLSWLDANASSVRQIELDLDNIGATYGIPGLSVNTGDDAGDYAIRYFLDNPANDPAVDAGRAGFSDFTVLTDDRPFFDRLTHQPDFTTPDKTINTGGFSPSKSKSCPYRKTLLSNIWTISLTHGHPDHLA